MPQTKRQPQPRSRRNGQSHDRDSLTIPPPPRARPRKLGMPLEVRFRQDQEELIEKFRKQDGVNKADIVRIAVDYYIQARQPKPPKGEKDHIADYQYAFG